MIILKPDFENRDLKELIIIGRENKVNRPIVKEKELEEGTLVEIEMPEGLTIPKREIVFLYDEKNINPSLGKFLNILK